MFSSNQILGEISEMEFCKRCLSKDIIPYKPIVDEGVDYIISRGGRFQRVQVKRAQEIVKGGYVGILINNLGKYRELSPCDLFAIHKASSNQMWLVPVEHLSGSCISMSNKRLHEWEPYQF